MAATDIGSAHLRLTDDGPELTNRDEHVKLMDAAVTADYDRRIALATKRQLQSKAETPLDQAGSRSTFRT
eukprot:98608-Pyramimonas_sp.AAC.1